MTKKDYMFAVIAGFAAFAIFYANAAIEATFIFSDSYIFDFLYFLGVPIASAVLAVLLVRHKQFKYAAAKLGLFVVAVIASHFLLFLLPVPSLNDVFAHFNPRLVNSVGQRGAMGWFGLGIMTMFYLGAHVIALGVYLCVAGVKALLRKNQKSNPSEGTLCEYRE